MGPGPSPYASNQLMKLSFGIVLGMMDFAAGALHPDFHEVVGLLLQKWSRLRLPLDECTGVVEKLLELSKKPARDCCGGSGSELMRYFAAAPLDVELIVLAPAIAQFLPCGTPQMDIIWTLFKAMLAKAGGKQLLALNVFPKFFANICFAAKKLCSQFVHVLVYINVST